MQEDLSEESIGDTAQKEHILLIGREGHGIDQQKSIDEELGIGEIGDEGKNKNGYSNPLEIFYTLSRNLSR